MCSMSLCPFFSLRRGFALLAQCGARDLTCVWANSHHGLRSLCDGEIVTEMCEEVVQRSLYAQVACSLGA
jgi:hypothetical protein